MHVFPCFLKVGPSSQSFLTHESREDQSKTAMSCAQASLISNRGDSPGDYAMAVSSHHPS